MTKGEITENNQSKNRNNTIAELIKDKVKYILGI